MYWHKTTDKWIVYSYGNEGFNWLSPKLVGLLLGQDQITGILRGAPILVILVTVGYISAYKHTYLPKYWFVGSTICLLLNIYIYLLHGGVGTLLADAHTLNTYP